MKYKDNVYSEQRARLYICYGYSFVKQYIEQKQRMKKKTMEMWNDY